MSLTRVLQLFTFGVFTTCLLNGVRILLNEPSDVLLIVAGAVLVIYGWIAIKSKAFTKNPFKDHE